MLKLLRRIGFVIAVSVPLSLGAATAAFAATNVYKLSVNGLACPFCAYGVEKKVGDVAGVKSIDIDIDSGTVTVTMKPGASLDKATAQKAVSDAGFSLQKFEEAKGK